ncbi:hypothetical protein BH10PAT3_BH10PAT3_2690 [soil metagenome]
MHPYKRVRNFIYTFQAMFLIILPVLYMQPVQAAYLTQRTIKVDSPIASAVTNYRAGFNLSTAAPLGSIQLIFCSVSPLVDLPCAAPTGFDIGNSTLSGQTGETGFTISPASTANSLILTRISSASLPGPVSYDFTGVTNPSTANSTVYMRIITYATVDATGTETDRGAAAFSTSGSFGTSAFVPPHLDFCVGVSVDAMCATTSGSNVSFGDLTSVQTASVTSQCAAATNDPAGYVIYSLGTTMTSGNHEITAMNIANPSLVGMGQFGINLKDNNNPNSGSNISGSGTGSVMPEYDTADIYKFQSGAAVAQATQSTDYNVYTTTYITNIPADQPIGVYVTTISYMAVAQF